VIEPIYLYGGLMFVVLLVGIIVTNTSVSNLEKRFTSNLESTISQLEFDQNRASQELWDLEQRFQTLENKDKYIQIYDINIVDSAAQEDYYEIMVDFALTERTSGADTILVFDGEEDIRINLEEGELRQQINVTLELYTDYLIYVEVDNGLEEEIHDIRSFQLYQYLKDRFSLQLDFDASSASPSVRYSLVNNWENSDHANIKIERINVQVLFNGGVLTDETYVTPNISTSHYQEFFHSYQYDIEDTSGTWIFYLSVIDEFDIVYENLLD